MARNIELKARVRDPRRALRVARQVATRHVGIQHQIDTYFVCARGRLKLRQIDNSRAELVAYERTNDLEPKPCDYHLVPVTATEELKAALTASLGIRSVVVKQRDIFLYHNVRIHLDEVEGLGSFLEFEAVLDDEHGEAEGRQMVEKLSELFGLRDEDILPGSYGEMV